MLDRTRCDPFWLIFSCVWIVVAAGGVTMAENEREHTHTESEREREN